jgi:hypothetical protein
MTKGRPLKFGSPEELWKLFEEWQQRFNPVEGKGVEEIPDIEGFCDHVNAYRDIFSEYERKPDFSDTIKQIKNWIYHKKKQLAMQGKMPPAIFIFDAKNNAGYTDKTEQDINHSGEVQFTNDVPRPNH